MVWVEEERSIPLWQTTWSVERPCVGEFGGIILTGEQNTALYSAFAVFGFFGGTFVNKIGVKWTLAFGGVGYCIYAISLLVSVHASVYGFNIFAGVWLGICAGLLWTAQGTIMVSYPLENQKGAYFAWFWGIFNLGAVAGSLVGFPLNILTPGVGPT